jgi:cytochrome P450
VSEIQARPEGVRPFREVPRPELVGALRNLMNQGGGRLDMLTPLSDLHAEHGPVVSQGIGRFRMVNLFGPDANRFVLLDRDRVFSSKIPWTMIMGRIFPGGLLLRDGDEHKHHRRIMFVAFKRPALRQYLERMNPMIEARLADWRSGGGTLLAFPAFKELTLDIAASIFVGVDLGPETRRMNRVFEDLVAASMSRIRLPLPGLEFQRGLQGREFMTSFFSDLLDKKRSGDGPDMFTRLCHAETEEGEGFDDREVIDHMIFLMMAAHDTTTSTLSSMTYELARNPDWQERVREESRALGKDALDFDDVERLEALGWVMRETIRRYPPLPVIPRTATAPFRYGGYEIPAGTMVVIAPIHTHHMEEWWTDPHRFDPERFAPARREDQRHTHAWIPFGGGPHHCLGLRFAELQVKAVIHQLVCAYRWSVPAGYEMPLQQAPISKPRDGLPIRIEPLRS